MVGGDVAVREAGVAAVFRAAVAYPILSCFAMGAQIAVTIAKL